MVKNFQFQLNKILRTDALQWQEKHQRILKCRVETEQQKATTRGHKNVTLIPRKRLENIEERTDVLIVKKLQYSVLWVNIHKRKLTQEPFDEALNQD